MGKSQDNKEMKDLREKIVALESNNPNEIMEVNSLLNNFYSSLPEVPTRAIGGIDRIYDTVNRINAIVESKAYELGLGVAYVTIGETDTSHNIKIKKADITMTKQPIKDKTATKIISHSEAQKPLNGALFSNLRVEEETGEKRATKEKTQEKRDLAKWAKEKEFPNFHTNPELYPLRIAMRIVGASQSRPRIFVQEEGKTSAAIKSSVIADEVERYAFATQYTEGKRVLDLGCGTGKGTAELLPNAKETVGVDYDKSSIDYAKKRYPNKEFVEADIIQYLSGKENGKFDTILCLETLADLKEPEKALGFMYEKLEAGGTLIVSTPNKIITDVFYGKIFNKAHNQEFYNYELAEMLRNIFGKDPQLFALRPVEKNKLIRNGIGALGRKPEIIPLNDNITGVNSIFVIQK